MAYTKQNWENSPSTATPITATALNHLETQYEEAVADSIPRPAGGTAGQVLTKTNTSQAWSDIPPAMPEVPGGAEGQVLTRTTTGQEWANIPIAAPFQFTPVSATSPTGQLGEIRADNNYLYTWTTTGWKRTPVSSW
jgi:hypothetical protein